LRAILLPAAMAANTSGGALAGAIAMPFTILPFSAGWNWGSLGETPPVLFGAPVLSVAPVLPVVPLVSPSAEAGTSAAPTSRQTTNDSGLLARVSNLFRTPTGLADGLALKELARFPPHLGKKIRPENLVPRLRVADSAWRALYTIDPTEAFASLARFPAYDPVQ
jgi:hypothetical protein